MLLKGIERCLLCGDGVTSRQKLGRTYGGCYAALDRKSLWDNEIYDESAVVLTNVVGMKIGPA